jgi:hypothetical protein
MAKSKKSWICDEEKEQSAGELKKLQDWMDKGVLGGYVMTEIITVKKKERIILRLLHSRLGIEFLPGAIVHWYEKEASP